MTLVFGCSKSEASPPLDPKEAYPGGDTTVSVVPFPSSELPAKNLPVSKRPKFFAGKALAHQPWVKAPTATDARDGLGPLYNARTCLSCHQRGGRGRIDENAPLSSSFLRLSVPGQDERAGAVPEPNYGLQLQTQSVALAHQLRGKKGTSKTDLPPEATLTVSWEPEHFSYPDGHQISLRRPNLKLSALGYGELHREAMMSLRVAPPIHGAGLIELIPQDDILALADPQDDDEDGVSGRVNTAWDFRRERAAPGRFGYKANHATLEGAVAAAFAGDIGITNPLFPEQPCTTVQEGCRSAPTGNGAQGFELPDELLALVVDFNRNLGVPERRSAHAPQVLAGRREFYELGCATCHAPKFTTKKSLTHPHLSEQTVWPYSDFLLHDMGPELADNRPDYDATGSEWRTTPLWGIGVSQRISGADHYLHDGRARTLEEAIVWHGGEAASSKSKFGELSSKRRGHLLAFLRSL